MATEIRINPLDFEPDVAVGISLPIMGANGTMFQKNYTTLDQAETNALNLLLTEKGERIMQPTFGCDLKKILFENITQTAINNLITSIEDSFAFWLPYIVISRLDVIPNEDSNRVFVGMTISLSGNEVDTRSIQIEININQ